MVIDFRSQIPGSPPYHVIFVRKTKRKYRKIYVPGSSYRQSLRALLPELEEIHEALDDSKVGYAFIKNRNCALMAQKHIGFNYTLSVDIQNFFESIRREHLIGLIPDAILDQVLLEGAPQQGLPTSPLVAAIAFLKTDRRILEALESFRTPVIYTRYADDLIFSFNDRGLAEEVYSLVRERVESAGFMLNPAKTKFQSALNGRRVITGISVDDTRLHATRRTKKKIRAAIHQKKHPSARGLIGWAMCKLPEGYCEI